MLVICLFNDAFNTFLLMVLLASDVFLWEIKSHSLIGIDLRLTACPAVMIMDYSWMLTVIITCVDLNYKNNLCKRERQRETVIHIKTHHNIFV